MSLRVCAFLAFREAHGVGDFHVVIDRQKLLHQVAASRSDGSSIPGATLSDMTCTLRRGMASAAVCCMAAVWEKLLYAVSYSSQNHR